MYMQLMNIWTHEYLISRELVLIYNFTAVCLALYMLHEITFCI